MRIDRCALQEGRTPLHLAAENDHSDVVKLFLKNQPELVSFANTVRSLSLSLSPNMSLTVSLEIKTNI